MRRQPIPVGEFNAMPRITPTAYAEAAYRPRGYPAATGPAGIAIPDARQVFRPTNDPPTLGAIVKRAYIDLCAQEVPSALTASVAKALAADMLARFPAAEMDVLEKYELSSSIERIGVDMWDPDYAAPVYLTLAEPVRAPKRLGLQFAISEAGAAHARVPAELLPYFHKIAQLRKHKGSDFNDALHWPSQFKAREKRWPTWREIEAMWPLIGKWIADQRAAA